MRQVSPDDGLPQKICLKCAKNVETCYSFVCNVIETQNKLKRLTRAAEDEVSEVVALRRVIFIEYEYLGVGIIYSFFVCRRN